MTMLKMFEIRGTGRTVFEGTFDATFKDFEDAVSHEAARQAGVECIVTRNIRDFRGRDHLSTEAHLSLSCSGIGREATPEEIAEKMEIPLERVRRVLKTVKEPISLTGRIVEIVKLPDGTVVNQELIRAGFAWVYAAYCKKPICLEWNRLEAEAATAKLGLWKDKNPVPPWEWRREQRDKR